MPKVTFLFDRERDAWNYWHQTNCIPKWCDSRVPLHIENKCKNKDFNECKKDIIKKLSKIHCSELIGLSVKSAENAWRKIEKEFFSRMNKLTGKKWNSDIKAYLTTLGICPYNPDEPSFMFSFFYSMPRNLQTCGHEIMHLYFHKFYWRDIERKIGKEKTADLKEALTVLLNLEFKDLWFAEDKGYDKHRELRKFIAEEWLKEKSFDNLLKKCVEYLEKK